MQNNLRNRSVALASTFALALTGIVATAPAAQAQTPVELKPKVGVNLGAFVTDDFEMSVAIPTNLEASTVALRIENPDMEQLSIAFSGISTGSGSTSIAIRGFDATGTDVGSMAISRFHSSANVSYEADRGNLLTASTSRLTIDFDNSGTDDITAVVLSNIKFDDAGTVLDDRLFDVSIQLLDGSDTAVAYGAGNQGDVTVQAWVETEATPDYETVDSATASAAATIKWYDPKGVAVIPTIERFIDRNGGSPTFVANDSNDTSIGGKARFIRPDLNLDQVDLNKWKTQVTDDQDADVDSDLETAKQYVGSKDSHDLAGAVYFTIARNSDALTTSLHTVRIRHSDEANREFTSAGYTVPTSDQDYDLFVTVTDGDNSDHDPTAPIEASQTGGTNDTDTKLRPGTSSFTFNARLYESADAERAKRASQLIVATVTAGDFMPEGTELTISGASTALDAAAESVVVSGLTDSEGDFSITVTSSNPIALTGYTVDFYSVSQNNLLKKTVSAASVTNASTVAAEYSTAGVTGTTALTLANDVLSGSEVTVSASVADTYGQPTNLVGTKDLYVTVQATDTADLDETVAVASDGTASVTFDNYVLSGESDVINVYLHTGATYASVNAISGASKVASLYNPAGVAAVNAPATKSGTITYDDFILGKASSTNVAPNDNDMDITGTVVDANGAGVPGAVVTVDADGFQLRQKDTGNYFQDSITFTADAAGRFTVTLWAHTVSTTGVDVTITSGGQSATTEVKTYLPTGLDGKNLVFSMDVPTTPEVNKTYAIQASLSDKWGNPVATSGNTVRFQGVGSVTINSDTSAVNKSFGRDGTVTVFLRSVKDIEGPGSVTAELLTGADYTSYNTAVVTNQDLGIGEILTDVAGTVWDETDFTNSLEVDVNVGGTPAQSSTQKVNAGSFKGYVAVYALGYEGQRLSAKIGNDWVIVDPIVNNESANLARVTDFTGAGVDIAVRIYIDRVLIDTINLTTK